MNDIEIMPDVTMPPAAWRSNLGGPVPLTGAVLASLRQLGSSSGDRGLGVPVVAVGLVEAVAVCDGQFTPVLRCADPPGAITLEFTEKMRKQALSSLCRWVAVEGRLYSTETNRYRLEVHRLRAAHRIDERDQNQWR